MLKYMLKSITNIVNENEMKLVYNSLVLSHLNYCDVVWGGCGSTLPIQFRIQFRIGQHE